MEIENVLNINELITFMDEEAERTGRMNHKSKSCHGRGIEGQWDDRDEFPYMVFYLIQGEVEGLDGSKQMSAEMKSMWFDEEGNVTERPQRNTDTLYHPD